MSIQTLEFMDVLTLSPYHNLALEAQLLHGIKENTVLLYLWQNKRTVVIGKNQNAQRECNIQKLIEDKGHLCRRLSGGGAVYHDLGNLNFTFVAKTPCYDVQKQLDVIARAVQSLNIPVQKSGRNDLLSEGQKFSGNAFYKHKDCCMHHGTLLLNADLNDMAKYLLVSKEKLQAKGVSSVKARVKNLCISTKDMKKALLQAFKDTYQLPVTQIEIPKVSAENLAFFSSWDFIYGRNLPLKDEITAYLPFGLFTFSYTIKDNCILDCTVYSDAMEEDVISSLPALLMHQPLTGDAFKSALSPLKAHHMDMYNALTDFFKNHAF